MKLDIKKYMPHLDSLDLSQKRKEEILRNVWGMMQLSVDKAFGLHPVQTARGQVRKKIADIGKQRLESRSTKVKKGFDIASKSIEGNERKAG